LFASQTAIFRRIIANKEEHLLRYEEDAIAMLEAALEKGSVDTNPHELLVEYNHEPHLSLRSDPPESSTSLILDAVRNVMADNYSGDLDIFDIWNNDAVSLSCRGRLEALYDALIAAGINDSESGKTDDDGHATYGIRTEWEWVEPENCARWARRVRWKNHVPKERSIWESKDQDEVDWERQSDTHSEHMDGTTIHLARYSPADQTFPTVMDEEEHSSDGQGSDEANALWQEGAETWDYGWGEAEWDSTEQPMKSNEDIWGTETWVPWTNESDDLGWGNVLLTSDHV
jgi:hypothetical protein